MPLGGRCNRGGVGSKVVESKTWFIIAEGTITFLGRRFLNIGAPWSSCIEQWRPIPNVPIMWPWTNFCSSFSSGGIPSEPVVILVSTTHIFESGKSLSKPTMDKYTCTDLGRLSKGSLVFSIALKKGANESSKVGRLTLEPGIDHAAILNRFLNYPKFY